MKPKYKNSFLFLIVGLMVTLNNRYCYGFVCSGSMYDNPDFKEQVTRFSPYDKIFLIVDCSELEAGKHYDLHANWINKRRGIIRSDKYRFLAEEGTKRGIFFWLKLSKKGPMASMLSNQDFHEENFGDWMVETYLDGKKATENSFSIID